MSKYLQSISCLFSVCVSSGPRPLLLPDGLQGFAPRAIETSHAAWDSASKSSVWLSISWGLLNCRWIREVWVPWGIKVKEEMYKMYKAHFATF
jgi:hypothetical protein